MVIVSHKTDSIIVGSVKNKYFFSPNLNIRTPRTNSPLAILSYY